MLFNDRQVYSKQGHFSKDFGVMLSPYKNERHASVPTAAMRKTLGQCQTIVYIMCDST